MTGLVLATGLSGVGFVPAAGAAPPGQVSVARSAADHHAVSYQGNKGDGTAPEVQIVPIGESVQLAENTFARDDYDFEEWNTRSDGTGTAYQPAATVTPTANLTLYARWTPHTEVQIYTSATSQVFRTTDPARIGVAVFTNADWWEPIPVDEDPPSPGTIQIRNHGVLMRTLPADPYGFTELAIPTNLPLGRTEFTATYIPNDPSRKTITSDPVRFTIARASTVTRVTLRQRTLSAADQKKFKVRSGMTVSVQVAGVGTRTVAPGSVALTIGGKVTMLKLVNGAAKSALLPTAAGVKSVVATYRPSLDWWVRSTGRAAVTVR
ncbi:MAG: InlB B-repeat-containing protein [Nakamurella sp.]